MTGLRKRIAEHMERSWRTVPHATAFDEVDGTALAALRQALKPTAEQRGVRLTYMPLLIKLLLPVLKEFPIFNASLDEERREIIYKRSYHIGVAADSPEGLLVPVLRNADRLSLVEIADTVGASDCGSTQTHACAARTERQHLHAQQHRQLRWQQRHADHQLSRGGDSRGGATAREGDCA